jgi:hypothetical protein
MQHYVLTQQQSAAMGVPEWETIETLVIMLLYHSVMSEQQQQQQPPPYVPVPFLNPPPVHWW